MNWYHMYFNVLGLRLILIIIRLLLFSIKVNEYSLDVVMAYMNHIQVCAEMSVRNMLRYRIIN